VFSGDAAGQTGSFHDIGAVHTHVVAKIASLAPVAATFLDLTPSAAITTNAGWKSLESGISTFPRPFLRPESGYFIH
jgi:hypothetical protein